MIRTDDNVGAPRMTDDRAVSLAAALWQRHSPEGVQAAIHERIASRDGGSSPLRAIRGLDKSGRFVTLVDITDEGVDDDRQ